MKSSQAINEIAAALSKLQADHKGAELEAVNPFFKSKYSTLKDVWDSIRDSVGKNGLAILQDVTTKESSVSITTMITHSSGQFIEFGPLEVPFAKKDAQAVGSAISYGKRYALCAAVGVVSGVEDDDGNGAMPRKELDFMPTKETKYTEPKYINKEQLQALTDVIGNDEEYSETLRTYLKIDSLSMIESNKFPGIMKSAQKRREARMKAENDGF